MKRTVIILIVALFLVVGIVLLFPEEEKKRTVSLAEEGERLEVIDMYGDVVFEYSIDDFRNWAEKRWDDLFHEPPSFGEMREVDPGNFYRFDEGVSLSPDQRQVSFSVNDYAAAATISFIVFLDIEKEDVSLVKEENMGGVREIIWSPNGRYVSYILDTARARGDYLSIDNVTQKEKVLTLSGDDVLLEMPRFEDVSFSKDSEYVYFVSGEKEWRVNIKEKETEKVRDVMKGELVINAPGIEGEGWHLNTNENDLLKMEIKEDIYCPEENFCSDLLNKKEELAEKSVTAKGEKKEDVFIVEEIR